MQMVTTRRNVWPQPLDAGKSYFAPPAAGYSSRVLLPLDIVHIYFLTPAKIVFPIWFICFECFSFKNLPPSYFIQGRGGTRQANLLFGRFYFEWSNWLEEEITLHKCSRRRYEIHALLYKFKKETERVIREWVVFRALRN